jgi:hypothetical protein
MFQPVPENWDELDWDVVSPSIGCVDPTKPKRVHLSEEQIKELKETHLKYPEITWGALAKMFETSVSEIVNHFSQCVYEFGPKDPMLHRPFTTEEAPRQLRINPEAPKYEQFLQYYTPQIEKAICCGVDYEVDTAPWGAATLVSRKGKLTNKEELLREAHQMLAFRSIPVPDVEMEKILDGMIEEGKIILDPDGYRVSEE